MGLAINITETEMVDQQEAINHVEHSERYRTIDPKNRGQQQEVNKKDLIEIRYTEIRVQAVKGKVVLTRSNGAKRLVICPCLGIKDEDIGRILLEAEVTVLDLVVTVREGQEEDQGSEIAGNQTAGVTEKNRNLIVHLQQQGFLHHSPSGGQAH